MITLNKNIIPSFLLNIVDNLYCCIVEIDNYLDIKYYRITSDVLSDPATMFAFAAQVFCQ